MSRRIEIPADARRELDRLPDRVWLEAKEVIAEMQEDPIRPGSVPLRGRVAWYRVRFYRNQYRIVYQVSEKQHCVIVRRVRPRASAYAGL